MSGEDAQHLVNGEMPFVSFAREQGKQQVGQSAASRLQTMPFFPVSREQFQCPQLNGKRRPRLRSLYAHL
jgi:hypothetical protein